MMRDRETLMLTFHLVNFSVPHIFKVEKHVTKIRLEDDVPPRQIEEANLNQ
jgi:hypothetical protein